MIDRPCFNSIDEGLGIFQDALLVGKVKKMKDDLI
jgi:hypothetical protein